MKLITLILSGLLVACSATVADEDVEVTTVATGLEHPWALAFLPGGDFLVTERQGRLKRLGPDGAVKAEIGGVPAVDAGGQGGLLDVVLHPDFADNRLVYLTWAGAGEQGNATHLGRGTLKDNRLEDFQVLFVATPYVKSNKHFGSRLVFDGEGHLFMTVGERGERDRSQDINDHNGSVLRLNEDGSIPEDNPFVGRDDAKAAIYSYGHRNPQGATQHPQTGALWIHEHGPRGGDEINLPEPGANFGWPKATRGKEYWGPEIAPDSRPGMVDAIHYWTPSIAPSGMTFYTHERFPQWQGNLFVGALAKTHLARLVLDGTTVVEEQQLLNDRGWRFRDVAQGPDGWLYALTDHGDGRLLRIGPKGG
jgi:glucose/arabinose dehydrogenase